MIFVKLYILIKQIGKQYRHANIFFFHKVFYNYAPPPSSLTRNDILVLKQFYTFNFTFTNFSKVQTTNWLSKINKKIIPTDQGSMFYQCFDSLKTALKRYDAMTNLAIPEALRHHNVSKVANSIRLPFLMHCLVFSDNMIRWARYATPKNRVLTNVLRIIFQGTPLDA